MQFLTEIPGKPNRSFLFSSGSRFDEKGNFEYFGLFRREEFHSGVVHFNQNRCESIMQQQPLRIILENCSYALEKTWKKAGKGVSSSCVGTLYSRVQVQ